MNAQKVWKQDVPTDDESDILEEWAKHLRVQGYQVGRWRQTIRCREVTNISDFKNHETTPGSLLLVGTKWNLYFYRDSCLQYRIN